MSPLIISDYKHYRSAKSILGSSNGWLDGGIGIPFKDSKNYPYIINWIEKNKPISAERIISMLPVINNSEETEWNSLTLEVINKFGDNDEVLSNLESHCGSFGGSGSMAPYHKAMSTLMSKLENNPKDKIKNCAKKMNKYSQRRMKEEIIRDEDWRS